MWSQVIDTFKYEAFYIKTTSLNIKILLEFTEWHQNSFWMMTFLDPITMTGGKASLIRCAVVTFPALHSDQRAVSPDKMEALMKWFIISCTCHRKTVFPPLWRLENSHYNEGLDFQLPWSVPRSLGNTTGITHVCMKPYKVCLHLLSHSILITTSWVRYEYSIYKWEIGGSEKSHSYNKRPWVSNPKLQAHCSSVQLVYW